MFKFTLAARPERKSLMAADAETATPGILVPAAGELHSVDLVGFLQL